MTWTREDDLMLAADWRERERTARSSSQGDSEASAVMGPPQPVATIDWRADAMDLAAKLDAERHRADNAESARDRAEKWLLWFAAALVVLSPMTIWLGVRLWVR